jgi:hypothetical protein
MQAQFSIKSFPSSTAPQAFFHAQAVAHRRCQELAPFGATARLGFDSGEHGDTLEDVGLPR